MKNSHNNLLRFTSTQMPILTYFGKTEQRNGWEHSGRIAKTNIMVVITGGNVIFNIDENEYLLKKDDILFILEGEYYKAYTLDFCEYYFAHFTSDIVITDSRAPHTPSFVRSPYTIPHPQKHVYIQRTPCVSSENNAELLSVFAKISAQKQQNIQHLALTLSTLFYSVLLKISVTSDNYDLVPSKIRAMLNFINNNVMKNITLTTICEHFSLSKQYVCRLFKQHLNSSVNDVILSHKMATAGEYIQFSPLNITQISEKLGFENIYYFSRKFKEFYGISPSNYRKKM